MDGVWLKRFSQEIVRKSMKREIWKISMKAGFVSRGNEEHCENQRHRKGVVIQICS